MNVRKIRSKSILMVTSIFLIMFAFTANCFAETPVQRTLSVSGTADVMVTPDEAVFTLAVETIHTDIKKAKSDNDASVKKIKALTEELKLDPKNVVTDYINVYPSYTYSNNGENIFKGYVVRRGMVITLKELAKFEDLLTGILDSGANYIQNVQFRTTQLRKYKDEARSMAVKAAKEKAAAMAKELGQTIGKANMIQEIQEDVYSSPWGYSSYSGTNWSSNAAMSNTVVNAPGASGLSENNQDFSPGQIKVTARVSVTFDLN